MIPIRHNVKLSWDEMRDIIDRAGIGNASTEDVFAMASHAVELEREKDGLKGLIAVQGFISFFEALRAHEIVEEVSRENRELQLGLSMWEEAEAVRAFAQFFFRLANDGNIAFAKCFWCLEPLLGKDRANVAYHVMVDCKESPYSGIAEEIADLNRTKSTLEHQLKLEQNIRQRLENRLHVIHAIAGDKVL